MSKSAGRMMCVLGMAIMAHAAFAMAQFRHYVRATGDALLHTPMDIILEALLALVLCSVGASWWAGSFKRILAAPTLWARRYDGFSSVEEFQHFSHRGKAFAQWKLHTDTSRDGKGQTRASTAQQQDKMD